MPLHTSADKNPANTRLWLALILLLGVGLRLYHLGAESLWYDETASTYFAQFADFKGSLFDPACIGEPPMQAIFMRLWMPVANAFAGGQVISERADFALRLWPCCWSVLSILLVYAAARALLRDTTAALIAAFLFAISPFQIHYAQELRIYSFYVALSLAALICMVRALEGGTLRWWAGLVLCMTLLPYSHFFSIWTIFSFNVAYVVQIWSKRRQLPRWFLANLLMMILIAPALYLAWRANAGLAELEYKWYDNPTWKTGLITFKDFFAGYGPSTWAYWPLFALATALFAIGLLALLRHGRWAAASTIFLLTVLPVAGNVFMWSVRYFSYYQHRLFIFSAAIAVLGIAYGIAALRRPALIAVALALFAAFTVPGLRDHYLGRLHPVEAHRTGIWDKVDFRSAAAYIDSHWQDGDLITHASHFTVYSIHHYLDRPHVRLGAVSSHTDVFMKGMGDHALLESHGLLPVRMDLATADARRLWFLESTGTTFEYKPLTEPIRAGLDRFWHVVERKTFNGLLLSLYERPDPAKNPWPSNVLFVLVDTLRADRVEGSRNGQPIMPFLASFTRQGRYYPHAVTPSSWTKPAMASLFTALYPGTHGVLFSAETEDPAKPTSDCLPGEAQTLAEFLEARGYSNFGFQTNANCTPNLGFDQGFNGGYEFENGATGEAVTTRILEMERNLAPPFFLYAHYFDPHAPYTPAPADRDVFGPLPGLPDHEAGLLESPAFMRYYLDTINTSLGVQPAQAMPPLSEAGRAAVQQLYDAECRYTDHQLQHLIETVQRRSPNTIVVLVSDHGEEFWEHGSMGHGVTLYEDQLRVPMLLVAPKLPPAREETAVETLRLLPTLATLLDAPANPAWQAESLLDGTTQGTSFFVTRGSWSRLQVDLAGVLEPPLKLIEDRYCQRTLLYDLAADPLEQHNLAETQPESRTRLQALLATHEATVQANPLPRECGKTSALSPEEMERLQAIGYLGTGTTNDAPPARICPPEPGVTP